MENSILTWHNISVLSISRLLHVDYGVYYFQVIYINGLTLSAPNRIWKRFYKELNPEQTSRLTPDNAFQKLNLYFEKQHQPIVLIIDEVSEFQSEFGIGLVAVTKIVFTVGSNIGQATSHFVSSLRLGSTSFQSLFTDLYLQYNASTRECPYNAKCLPDGKVINNIHIVIQFYYLNIRNDELMFVGREWPGVHFHRIRTTSFPPL